MIIQSIIVFTIVMFLLYLLIHTTDLIEISDDIIDNKWENEYKWRIVEITHKDNSKTYSLQIKSSIFWYDWITDCSLETCKDCYNTLQQYKKEAEAKKINTTIINKKIININKEAK